MVDTWRSSGGDWGDREVVVVGGRGGIDGGESEKERGIERGNVRMVCIQATKNKLIAVDLTFTT